MFPTPYTVGMPNVSTALHSADDLYLTPFVKFCLLPLRFRDNFPIHSDGDTGLGGIQLQGDEQVVDIYIKANLFGFTVNAYFHVFHVWLRHTACAYYFKNRSN